MTDKPELSHDNQIEAYLHCALCMSDIMEDRAPGQSPASYANYNIGWTPRGLQVWCNRHDCNICNIDFEGAQHPAIPGRSLALD